MRKANGSYASIRDKYFVRMIDSDRVHIKKRITQLTGQQFDLIKNKNFDEEIPQIMKNITVKDHAPIHQNASYNITYIPVFRDVAYYEFILPYLNKDKLD